jgi:hypothetical protein
MKGPHEEDILVKLSAQLSMLEQEDLRQRLIDHVNYLLLNDFNRLVQLLYRVDVDEIKLKNLLHDQPQTDAGILIADLLIQRQHEKQQASPPVQPKEDIPEDDKW